MMKIWLEIYEVLLRKSMIQLMEPEKNTRTKTANNFHDLLRSISSTIKWAVALFIIILLIHINRHTFCKSLQKIYKKIFTKVTWSSNNQPTTSWSQKPTNFITWYSYNTPTLTTGIFNSNSKKKSNSARKVWYICSYWCFLWQ